MQIINTDTYLQLYCLGEIMLHLGNKTDQYKTPVPFRGFKIVAVVFLGIIIGSFATNYVQPPISSSLLISTQHDRTTASILHNLDTMGENVLIIKKDILIIKRKFEIDAENTYKGE